MSDITCTFTIEEKYAEQLRKIAEDNYRSLSAQIRLVLEAFLEKGR